MGDGYCVVLTCAEDELVGCLRRVAHSVGGCRPSRWGGTDILPGRPPPLHFHPAAPAHSIPLPTLSLSPSSVLAFPLTSRGTLRPGPYRVLPLPYPHSDVNALRFGYYHSEPLLCCVDMAGVLTLFFIRDPAGTPHTLTCHLPLVDDDSLWRDNSAWSVSFTPRYCPDPYLVVSTNAHRVFYVTLSEGERRMEGATVVVGQHVHGHNIPSTDIDSSGRMVASGSLDRQVRVMKRETRGARREGEGEGSASAPSSMWTGQWGTEWVWAVRFFPSWCVKRGRRQAVGTATREQSSADPQQPRAARGLDGIERVQGYLHLVRDLLDRVADGFLPGEGVRRRDARNEEERQEVGGQGEEEEAEAEEAEEDEGVEDNSDEFEEMEDEVEEEEVLSDGMEDDEEEEVDEEFHDAHSIAVSTPPPSHPADSGEGTTGQPHDGPISPSNPSAPSSSSITPTSSSLPSPFSPAPLSDLLLYSNSRTLYLISPQPNARVLSRIANPTSHLHTPHLRDVQRNSFLLTIPPLSLVVLGSPSSDRVNLWRVVQYEGEDVTLEGEMELPLILMRCGVKGVEVSEVEGRGEGAEDGGVWVLYILWEDGHLAAYQLSQSSREEEWTGRERCNER